MYFEFIIGICVIGTLIFLGGLIKKSVKSGKKGGGMKIASKSDLRNEFRNIGDENRGNNYHLLKIEDKCGNSIIQSVLLRNKKIVQSNSQYDKIIIM